MQTEKSLAVLETAAHAGEVRACAQGKDMIEYTYAPFGRADSAFGHGLQRGKDWESMRPLEVRADAPPWVQFGKAWQRGRFCAFSGLGGAPVRVLKARKVY